MAEHTSSRLWEEIKSFQDIWPGGYYEGDIFDYHSYSGYGPQGYIGVLHAVYLSLVKPYIKTDTDVLEIGPGRGTFTRGMLGARSITCLDALSAEHNRFWEAVGKQDHVRYIQVSDFSCNELPENRFDYLFTFGALCHVSFEGISLYARNLHPKLRSGANCFAMIADYDKFNRAYTAFLSDNIYLRLPYQKLLRLNWWLYRMINRKRLAYRRNLMEDDRPKPKRWYNAGLSRTCEMLAQSGYRIVSEDVGLLLRDPIIHFVKD